MLFGRKKVAAEGTVHVDAQDIIHIKLTGHQTASSLKAFNKRVKSLMATHRAAGKKVRMLADLTGVFATSPGARQESKEFLNTDYDSLAIIGNAYLQPLILFTLRSVETTGVARYFHSKSSALNWLRHNPEKHPYKRRALKLSAPRTWIVLVIVALLLLSTYASWQQSVARNETRAQSIFDQQVADLTDKLYERLHVYEATLHGFRGMFHASNEVSEKEFRDYFDSLDLAENNPGFNALTFVTRVSDAQLPSFIQKVRNDNSLYPKGHPNFTPIINESRSEHFIVTYSTANADTSSLGIDLGNSSERLETLEHARDLGVPQATESINLFNAQGQEQQNKGFLITIPVYEDRVPVTVEERRAKHRGFINAIFNYQTFLNDTLKPYTPAEISVKIYDNNHTAIYEQGSAPTNARVAYFPLTIAGRTWHAEVHAPSTFGLVRSEINNPRTTLFFGILLSGFIMIISWLQNRARRRALQLADTVTADLQRERNLAVETKNKDESILASIGDGVFALDEHGKVMLFNKAAEQISGYSAAEILGKPYDEILKFRDSIGNKSHTQFIQQAQKGAISSMEDDTFLLQKNGLLREVADSAAPIFDAKGKQSGIIVVFRDVTDEKKFERAIQASNERYELVAKATNDAVFDLDLKTGAMLWSEALYTQYGYKKTDVKSTLEWWVSNIHPDDSMKLEEEISSLLVSRKRTWESEYRFKRSDGTYAYVRARSFVQRDEQNEPTRLISSMLDITKQKELDQAKDEFISLVSHQLRTPLTAIRLFTEMLVDGQVGKLTNDQQSYLEKVDASTQRMIQLVGDILNISRVELGRLKIAPVETDVPALITSHVDEVEPLASAKKVKITFKPTTKLPNIAIDPILFGQIVHNLLTNAIRYSNGSNGRVEVQFTKKDESYVLAVSDNGIGIPKAAQARIFERFFRAENAVKAEGEGTGLGLYLIKLVLQSSGGNVWFESKEGQGTTFYVSIPLSGMVSKAGDKSLN